MNRSKIISAILLLLTICSASCVGPTLGGSDQPIPDRYPESEVFYLADSRNTTSDGRGYLALLPSTQGMTRGTPVEEGAAITVLAQGVRLPQMAPSRMDAVVVVDVRVAGSDKPTEPVVVGHFPNAQPGQRLPFQSLRVFGTDTWDPKFPLEFRVRVFDWREKQNERIIAAVQQAEVVAQKLSSGVLVISDPIVKTAVDAAADLIRYRPNLPIVDFKVGMYSAKQVQSTAGRIPLLRQGSWLVAAKPKGTTPEFWMQSFAFADPGQAIFLLQGNAMTELLDMPFLEVAIGQFSSQPGRSRLLEDVSEVLVDIGSAKWVNDPDSVARSSYELWSTASRLIAVRRFEAARDDHARMNCFRALIALLSEPGRLQPVDRDELLSYVRARAGASLVPSDPQKIADWWKQYGEAGTIDSSGKWLSPVEGWIRELRFPDPALSFSDTCHRTVPRLLHALRASSDVAAVESGVPIVSDASTVSAEERDLIVGLFDQMRSSDPQFTRPLDSPELVIQWWESFGRFGEMRASNGQLIWMSPGAVIAERILLERARPTDYRNAASIASQKPLALAGGNSIADTELQTLLKVTSQSDVDRATVLSALRQQLPSYDLVDSAAVERWWNSVGKDGRVESGSWRSPVPEAVDRYKQDLTISLVDTFERWVESQTLSATDMSLLPRDGLLWPLDSGSSLTDEEGTFASVRGWLGIVRQARSSFGDAKVLEGGDGVKQFMPGWLMRDGVPLSRDTMQRVLLLHQHFLASPHEYVGRFDGIDAFAHFVERRVRPAQLPTASQREAFLSGSVEGQGRQSVWRWKVPD